MTRCWRRAAQGADAGALRGLKVAGELQTSLTSLCTLTAATGGGEQAVAALRSAQALAFCRAKAEAASEGRAAAGGVAVICCVDGMLRLGSALVLGALVTGDRAAAPPTDLSPRSAVRLP